MVGPEAARGHGASRAATASRAPLHAGLLGIALLAVVFVVGLWWAKWSPYYAKAGSLADDADYQAEMAKQHAAQMGARKAMMGSGDRSARIRTYNFPQNRCTDHRLGGEGGGEKNFNLDQIMAGQLDSLIEALLIMDKQQRLENL